MDTSYGAMPSYYLIGVNNERGCNPITPAGRTPPMPETKRRVCDYELSGRIKNYFMEACLRAGYRVFDVKPEAADISVSERRRRIEKANPSLLITFGCNACKNRFNPTGGLEVYYSELNMQAKSSKKLSENIYYELLEGSGQNGRGVNTIDIMVTATVKMPSVLIEPGFLTNINDARLMLDPDFQKIIGEYACAGVSRYLGLPFTPSV